MAGNGDGATETVVIETGRGRVSLARTGQGPDLVLLHSLLTDRHAFDPVVGDLARRWRVNAVDLPGFGSTARTERSIDAYADLVAALLEEAGLDPHTTALLGNGLGGFVALGAAVRHGSRFDRLVLVGAGAGFAEEGRQAFAGMIERVRAGGMEGVVETALLRIYPEEFLGGHPEMAAERREVLLRTDPDAFVDACTALIGVDYTARLAGVANPTLVVVGSEDAATPPALARALAATIPGAELREIPGVGHTPQLQAPRSFLEAVGGFLGLDEPALPRS